MRAFGSRRLTVAVCASLLSWATVAVLGQAGGARVSKPGEWPVYGADNANTRYSPLDQINAANFSKLEIAWRFKTEGFGPRPEFQFESTPLMVDGIVYTTAGTRRAAVALDAGTGEILWTHSEQEGERGGQAPRQLSGRGLSYWTDGKEARIIYVTPGYRMIALDAKTGIPVPTFGDKGVVDLKQNLDQVIDPVTGEIGLHSTPAIANDVIVVGAAHRSGGVPRGKSNVKGYVRGFDVRTGKRLWIFHTIPRPGEFGNDSWLNDSWSYTGNTGVWAQISIDPQLNMAYLPVETPTGDYYGGHRPGAGLFGESIVAVDLKTGVRKWHFQLVHHGIWDHDIPCAPILADIVVNGRTIKALAQPTKQAFMYVFDRETGKPVWPIEERSVPAGDVPGEWYAPTQPFPLDANGKIFSYDRQGFLEEDVVDFTPDIKAEGLKLISRYKIGPVFTPIVVSKAEGPLATIVLGSNGGGTVWAGGSFDPETRVLYVYSRRSPSPLGLVKPDPAKNDMNFVQGSALTGARTTAGAGSILPPGSTSTPATPAAPAAPAAGEGGGGGLSVRGLPIVKPPYGSISAIDLNKGLLLWTIPHGDTPDNIRNNPALKGLDIPRTGQAGIIGTLSTRSLLIAGEAQITTNGHPRGALLRAYDKASGKDAGSVFMPAQQSGSPMTYLHNGRQYLVVAIGGGNYPGELLAFALPQVQP